MNATQITINSGAGPAGRDLLHGLAERAADLAGDIEAIELTDWFYTHDHPDAPDAGNVMPGLVFVRWRGCDWEFSRSVSTKELDSPGFRETVAQIIARQSADIWYTLAVDGIVPSRPIRVVENWEHVEIGEGVPTRGLPHTPHGDDLILLSQRSHTIKKFRRHMLAPRPTAEVSRLEAWEVWERIE